MRAAGEGVVENLEDRREREGDAASRTNGGIWKGREQDE